MTSTRDSGPPLGPLTAASATRWFLDAKGLLGRHRVGYVLDEDMHAPALSTPPTAEELKARKDWRNDCDAACSLLWKNLSDEHKNKDAVRQAYEGRDAKGMWAALRRIARPINVASRYSVFAELIRTRMEPNESLESLLNRVRTNTAEWRSLWPAHFTSDQMLTELAIGAFLNGLSVERQPWSSAVLVQLKQNATLDALEALARLEDANQTTFGNPAIKAMAARVGDAAHPKIAIAPSAGRTMTREEALAALHAALGLTDCFCSFIDIAIKAAIAARRAHNAQKNGPRKTANSATASASIVEVPEASVRHFVYSTLASLAARRDAASDWNTDTGCSAHMTPHRTWFSEYTPLRVPIELADHSIIYVAILESVVGLDALRQLSSLDLAPLYLLGHMSHLRSCPAA
ncbi:hypothetical protein AURDEDRAFT_166182 [Auricularia subglabra TFB-10046 SS5]|nr:hypothetical protein AURDEDRAFT_166182 [Auricularia subglabra TFB-10046 SS5]